jgi:NADH-quinone oxidoreductase subunit F
MKYSFCAFAPGAVAPVQALIEDFHAEVTAHIENQGCPFRNRQSDENYAESHH